MAHEILLNGGDSIDEGNLQTAFAAMGDGYIEQDALGVQYFDSDDTIDTEAALARVPDGNRDIPLFVDAIVNYQLEVGALNHVWLAVDPSAATDNEAIGLRHNTTGVAPTDPSLEIAEVDTNKSGDDAVTLLNRGTAPSLDGADINVRSVGRGQPAEDIAATSASIGTLAGATTAEDLTADSLDVATASAESLSGVTYLLDEYDESTVRGLVGGGSAGDAFVVEPGASWTLTDTLVVPDGCRIYGNTPTRGGGSTFFKGFDGDLVSIGTYSMFRDIGFHGKKADYSGHVVTGGDRNTRNTVFYQCNFRRGAGDGYHVSDNYFMTWINCIFQHNDGWGVWFGDGENPHNQMLGPCYIADNGAGGIYQRSHGRNQQFCAYVGKNGGPGIEFTDPNNYGGFVAFSFRGSITSNDGPGVLVTGGRQRAFRMSDTVLANNCANPDAGLTTPVGQIHIENGRIEGGWNGGQAYGHPNFVQSHTSANHQINFWSPGNGGAINGAIAGPNLSAMVSDMTNFSGPIAGNIRAGIGFKAPSTPFLINLADGSTLV